MSNYVTMGHDTETGEEITIGDIERRSGLYILGKPGMGKSALMVNLMIQDIENEHEVFFLDPHEDAITDLLHRGPYSDLFVCAHLFNPQDETYSFGINLLACRDVNSLTARTDTYTRAYNVFYKLWENNWGPWLQLILQNTLWAFIENQEYTLAEVPMFLNPRNSAFRNHIIGNVKHNPSCVDFWRYEFFMRRERDQQERVDAALTRVTTLLTHPYVRHIIGQRKTTIAYDLILNPDLSFICLFKLSANLPEDIKKFIGTILISELLHAVRNRPENEREQFCIFVDEFQDFASSEDFKTLITEARKFGIATTIAHQERFGQFAENKKLLGATATAVNKVFFQITVKDAQELAPEFAKEPTTTEIRLEPELVISQEPLFDLLRQGHANPRIQECVTKYLRSMYDNLSRLREEMEDERLVRMGFQDEATLYRDEAALSRAGAESERQDYAPRSSHQVLLSSEALDRIEVALEQAMSAHNRAQGQTKKLASLFRNFKHRRLMIRNIDRFLTALMEGHISPAPGQEQFAQFFIDVVGYSYVRSVHLEVFRLYIHLLFGDPGIPRSIPAFLAAKYCPQKLEETYMQKRQEEMTKHYSDVKEKRRGTSEQKPDEAYTQWMQWSLDKELMKYREGEITLGFGIRPFIKVKKDVDSFDKSWYKNKYNKEPPTHYYMPLPDLLPRILKADEIEIVKNICYNELLEGIRVGRNLSTTFKLLDDLVEFCNLLTKSENHIKVPSGQYIEKPVHVRPVHDMTDEMAQELANLPRFTAYAKVIQENKGEQTVWRGKIKTLPLPPWQESLEIESHVIESGHNFCKERTQIEEEIRQRQERWRGSISDEPPPIHS